MFSGIVESLGTVRSTTAAPRSAEAPAAATRLVITAASGYFDEIALGASVAVNGACLTLTAVRGSAGEFDVIPETLRRTTLHRLRAGDLVNLERSLRVGDRIDGHFVQGHVDAVGTLARVDRHGGEYKLWIQSGASTLRYVVPKGSVALDGTSLTVVDARDEEFSVALIPTTLERTVLGRRKPGDPINIETDILVRTILSRVAPLDAAAGEGRPGLSWDALRESGFVP